MAYKKLQLRRGLYKNLPTLAEGELGYCTDTNNLYVGSSSGNVQIMNIDAYVELKNHISAADEYIASVDKKIFIATYDSTTFGEIADAFNNNYMVYCKHTTTNIFGEAIERIYQLASLKENDVVYFVSFGDTEELYGDVRFLSCYSNGDWIESESSFQLLPEPSKEYAIPVSNGGRWGQMMLLSDFAVAPITETITLGTSWTASSNYYTQKVTVSGILSTDTPIIDLVTSTSNYEAEQEAWGKVFKATTGASSITFYATEKLTTKLTLQVKVVR